MLEDPELVADLAPSHEPLRDLGKGTFGRVVLARDVRIHGTPLVAIKLIERGTFVSRNSNI